MSALGGCDADQDWRDPFRRSTQRLEIFPCDPEAAETLAALVSDPKVLDAFSNAWPAHLPHAMAAARMRQDENTWRRSSRFNLAACERRLGKIIGCAQIESTSLSYFVDPAYWNRGYGGELAAACCRHLPALLGLSKLRASVFRENLASRRILEHAGFKFSGFDPQARDRWGRPATILNYVLTVDG